MLQTAMEGVAQTAIPDELPHEWGFTAGDEIAPGKEAQQLLGGGERYEAYVAWNAELLAPTVVKILRPDRRSRGARAGWPGRRACWPDCSIPGCCGDR